MQLSQVVIKRRKCLSSMLGEQIAVFHNGAEQYRNIGSQAYPFRSNSHILYFFGPLPKNAIGVISPERSYVFLEPQTADSVIWEGPEQGADVIQAASGCDQVLPKSELANLLQKLGKKRLCSLPVISSQANAELEALLGRKLDLSVSEGGGADRVLASSVIKLRLIHDELAIAELRQAAEVTVRSHLAGMHATEVGKFEYTHST